MSLVFVVDDDGAVLEMMLATQRGMRLCVREWVKRQVRVGGRLGAG